jgi:ferrous iron transport protein B
MLMGFGCSIPGIMATRTIEHERDRLTTMLVLPLISCGARLPIWALLIPAFFAPAWRAPMLWLMYATGVALALGLSLFLRRSILRGKDAPFVMDLPPYRLPTPRSVAIKMAERSWLYLRKAGTVILGISLLLWALAAYPRPAAYRVDADLAAGRAQELTDAEIAARRGAEALSYSLAGRFGRALEPLLRPLGFDWKIATGMIGAFAAKEVFVVQMGIIYSMGEADEGAMGLRYALNRDYSPLTGLSMMLFLLIGTPCMATFAVTRSESGAVKWALLQFAGLTAIAYLMSLTVYQVGRLLT